ncbi:glycosyl hydrolase [Streptomyces sp. NPDC085639]|uniref:glycosyl hydrolase n=1 Tax=Streptomyces sp. NPDC085639 TaxID=3365734 RepID=UPI0037D07C15
MNDRFDFAFDFNLDELAPADAASEEAVERFWSGDLTALPQHHTTPNGSHSFVVAHDQSATWGIPGAPQVMAIAAARDLNRFTYTLETSHHATVSFAQNWLVERGCPPEKIAKTHGGYLKPADDLTVWVERQIRESGARYEVLDNHTSDSDPCETWTLTRDASAAQAPVRLFHEEWDHAAGTYTMREGAFADVGAARAWLDDRSGPLPEPPEYSDHDGAVVRARIALIALARSAGAPATPKASLDATRTRLAGPVQRPVKGRLL